MATMPSRSYLIVGEAGAANVSGINSKCPERFKLLLCEERTYSPPAARDRPLFVPFQPGELPQEFDRWGHDKFLVELHRARGIATRGLQITILRIS
jgi:hypothetical protein